MVGLVADPLVDGVRNGISEVGVENNVLGPGAQRSCRGLRGHCSAVTSPTVSRWGVDRAYSRHARGFGAHYRERHNGVFGLPQVDLPACEPPLGQSLTLELPPGLERVEGKTVQPVPAVDAAGNALVQWRVRALKPGQFELRVGSSTGRAVAKSIEVNAGDAKPKDIHPRRPQ